MDELNGQDILSAANAPTFTPPPTGMLSEQQDFPAHLMSLGLLHIEGAGLRVAVWNGDGWAHMSPAKARRLADEYGLSGHLVVLAPVIKALRTLADRAEAILADVEARRVDYDLMDMDVEGTA